MKQSRRKTRSIRVENTVALPSTRHGEDDKNGYTCYDIARIRGIIRKTVTHVHNTKSLDIINGSDFNHCVSTLEDVSGKLDALETKIEQGEHHDWTRTVADARNQLSLLLRSYGTDALADLLVQCCGSKFVERLDDGDHWRWRCLKECAHPTSYRFVPWKEDKTRNAIVSATLENVPASRTGNGTQQDTRDTHLRRNRIVDDSSIVEHATTLDCFDMARTCKDFQQRVYGMKVVFQDYEHRRTVIVSSIVDDVPLWSFGDNSATSVKSLEHELTGMAKKQDIETEPIGGFVSCLTLKDVLIYSSEEIIQRFAGYVSQAKRLHRLPLANLVAEFAEAEQYAQRTILLQLLTMSHKPEYQYTAYLLFDILSADTGSVVDTHEQKHLFDSLPTKAKQFFKDALKRTVQYTTELGKFDMNKIPLEQQICLMKVDDSVKEKAMLKLKEVKNKGEESGTKARQYLEALLKIPFGIYREEPILTVKHEIKGVFNEMLGRIRESPLCDCVEQIPVKTDYTSLEIATYTAGLKRSMVEHRISRAKALLVAYVNEKDTREELFEFIKQLNGFIRAIQESGSTSPRIRKIPKSGRNIQQMLSSINDLVLRLGPRVVELVDYLGLTRGGSGGPLGASVFAIAENGIRETERLTCKVKDYINQVGNTLTDAVHGHTKAKRQIERIIGQWINGEQTGYCFGFEGPPGVGKTSLAKKGIANCLVDDNGSPRPFTFIAIGGASNGSTLEGHNYTYVASTWGRIVDVLMDKKCMNPIIFIDELDKVSRTEHGREIIGILTHLIDQTQNDSFQDKYFHGIDINVSKALFIFSYNDVDAIDRVLLDRIHRIKFSALTLDDKLTVTRDYLLPEVLNKMGLTGSVDVPDDVIKFVIEKYTNEPGVRKLRELFFEIIGEMNISILRGETDYELPIVMTVDTVKHHLRDKLTVRPYVISRVTPTVGVINGLYANSLGQGGVLPIEVSVLPSAQLLELHLTGMQGDVMKESMQVARTLAFKLAGSCLSDWLGYGCDSHPVAGGSSIDNGVPSMGPSIGPSAGVGYKKGLHIHVPEGATKKDGPSAGTAITIAIYSCITGVPIRHDVAITGEICLSGCVTAIGGLEEKVIGGIKAGVKHFVFPTENEKDYAKIRETYDGKGILDDIVFTSVGTIHEALALSVAKDTADD